MVHNKQPVLELHNVTFSTPGSDSELISDLSFKLNSHERLFIMGFSDLERTVILHVILGLVRIQSGTITLLGSNIASLNHNQLLDVRKRIGYMHPQNGLIQNITIRENIELPLQFSSSFSDDTIDQKVKTLVKICELEEYLDRKPGDVNNMVYKKAMLARTVINEPDLILFDEPTTYIEEKDRIEMKQLISRLLFDELIIPPETAAIITTEDGQWAEASNETVLYLQDDLIDEPVAPGQDTFQDISD
jgi:phospholipid/cholesterol/gamma-HCH transport system ATP-binding protein